MKSGRDFTRREALAWCGWLYLLTMALAHVVALRYLTHAEEASTVEGLVFRCVMYFAHLGTLFGVAMTPLVVAAVIKPHRRALYLIGVCWSTALLALLLVDTQVYHLYRMHVNLGVLNLVFGGAAGETFVLSRSTYLAAGLVLLGLLVLASLAAVVSAKLARTGATRPAAVWGSVTLAVTLLLYHGTHAWADAAAHEAIVKHTDVLPVPHALTARRLMRKLGVTSDSWSSHLRPGGSDDPFLYPTEPLVCDPPEELLNVVMILIDSWRGDAMTEAITPNIARFSRDATVFEDHLSGGNATRIGVFTMFYGLPGTYWHRTLREIEEPVLLAELRRAGMDMTVFRSAPLYSPEFDRTVFAGFENPRMRSDGKTSDETDADLTADFLEYLDARDEAQPFFTLLFYDSPHSFAMPDDAPRPFQPSLDEVNYLALDADTDPEPFRNLYYNSVHYVDSLVGSVLETLEARGLLDTSLVLITSDHGQQFNENGLNYWGHNSNYTVHQVHVPLVIRAPDMPRGARVSHRTSHFDLAPTLLGRYVGCVTDPSRYSVGRDLFEPGGRDMLLMSGYNDFALFEPDTISLVTSFRFRVFDHAYRPLSGAAPSPEAVADAFEQMSRFLE